MNTMISASERLQFRFDNSFTDNLPADPETAQTRRQVYNACYSNVAPTPVRKPQLVAASREVAEMLDISPLLFEDTAFAEIFAGNQVPEGARPHAMNYGGHQFGSWAGQLGDGRAITLGEIVNRQGQRYTLQLKGSGATPYSRQADGLAVLRSSIREFLCSEAMHHLGIPTTRALSVVETGEQVLRDMFYDGHPKMEPGAVVCRVAPTFIRFGNFEIHTSRKEYDLLKKLADYTITTFFPHLGVPSPEVYGRWFLEICERTVALMLEWMRVGFVHGVMNTDNMSILGLTIDYGPYGWLEGYEANWTPNTTDAHGRRYAFGNQPHICQWNLVQLANAIHPLIGTIEPLQAGLDRYMKLFTSGWQTMMTSKIGLFENHGEEDNRLAGDLIDLLQVVETDMTIFFRSLAGFHHDRNQNGGSLYDHFAEAYYDFDKLPEKYCREMNNWLTRYLIRRDQEQLPDSDRIEKMNRINPKYVLRNYMAQLAIDKAEHGDYSLVGELLELLRRPYDEQPESAEYFRKRPEWARNRPGCSMLSCSS